MPRQRRCWTCIHLYSFYRCPSAVLSWTAPPFPGCFITKVCLCQPASSSCGLLQQMVSSWRGDYPCLCMDILHPGVISIVHDSLVIFVLKSPWWWGWCPCSPFCNKKWEPQNAVSLILLSALIAADSAEEQWLLQCLWGHRHASLGDGFWEDSATMLWGRRAHGDGNGRVLSQQPWGHQQVALSRTNLSLNNPTRGEIFFFLCECQIGQNYPYVPAFGEKIGWGTVSPQLLTMVIYRHV